MERNHKINNNCFYFLAKKVGKFVAFLSGEKVWVRLFGRICEFFNHCKQRWRIVGILINQFRLMQLSGLTQLIVITMQTSFKQLIVNLKLFFPPLTFSFPAFCFQVFDRCGVSPWCFLFAQGALDSYRCNSFHYIQNS